MTKKVSSFYLLLVLGALAVSLTGCRKDHAKVIIKPSSDQQLSMPLETCDDEGFFNEDVEAFVLEEESLGNPFESSLGDQVRLAAHEHETPLQDFTLEQLDTKDEMSTVYFAYDSKSPRQDQKELLHLTGQKAQEIYQQGKVVCCKGHSCNWHGTRAYNLALSQSRAESMAGYLEREVNIPKNRIKVFGVGNEEPIALENSKDGQAPNRRVEVYALAA